MWYYLLRIIEKKIKNQNNCIWNKIGISNKNYTPMPLFFQGETTLL